MGLFSKVPCVICGKNVGFFSRKRLINKEGYICKECENKCSEHINVGHFTKAEIQEHISYMEKQDKLYKAVYEPLDKSQKSRFVSISTGLEFADELAMFKFISPKSSKKTYQELFRYDQISHYEPYFKDNTNSNSDKKYAEVGLKIYLNCSRHQFGEAEGASSQASGRNVHPYVRELQVPTARNVNDFSHVGLKDYLDKLFGVYEDNSVVGSIKSSFMGTNKERSEIKVAAEGLKALGNLTKSKITKNEEDAENAKASADALKEDALNLATGNRAMYTKIANSVEDKIFN